jgi:protein involved in polysaccharide export with SLBB domain
VTRSARVAAAVLAAGCADRRQTLPPTADAPVFRAGCGDVLRVRFADRPGLDGVGCVAADGALPLGPLGRVPADQLTVPEIRQAVAAAAGLPPEAVAVDVAEVRSATVYVRGPGGRLAAVPFVGDESVAGFLRRAGFVAAGDVTVTRPQPDGPPRAFAVPASEAVAVAAGDTVTVGR